MGFPFFPHGNHQLEGYNYSLLLMLDQHVCSVAIGEVLPYHSLLRDWSLITRRGGYKMGKSRVRNLLRPPTSRQSKTFFAPPPLLKSGNILRPPPSIWLKLPYHIKTTLPFVPPPSAWLKLFSAPPPFYRGKTSHPPPPAVL